MPRPVRSVNKAKDFKKSLKRFFGYTKRHLPVVIIAILLAVASTVLTLLGPDKLSEITDTISAPFKVLVSTGEWVGIDLNSILKISITLVVFYGLSAIFGYSQGFLMSGVTQKVSKQMRDDISKKINRLPLKYLDSTPYGDVLSRVSNDVDSVSQSLNNSVTTLVSSIAMFAGCIVMMFVTNWIMAISAITASLIGVSIMGIVMSRSQKYFKQQQEVLGSLNGHIEEVYSGQTIVKAYNAEREVSKKFNENNKKLYSSAWKSQFLSGLMGPLMNFIGNFGYVVVCIVGSALAIKGNITFGVIIAFMVYVRLFTQPLSQLAQCLTNVQQLVAAGERVFEFLDEKEMETEQPSEVLKNIKGNVEFKNVKFGYNPDKTIIHNFSAKIKAGQKVAIVGPTGAGKTTLVNLLMRFYEIDEGDIYIDGINTKNLSRENIHDLFGMVLQDTWMFEGTVRENIVYSKQNVSDETIMNACRECGIHHFIKTLPQGYDTILNDNTSISAGQKQLLTIARAMVQDNPMLILDEATSSVDTRTEILIQKAMDKLMKNRTTFVIAHRLSTIKNADLILVLKDGDIVEKGKHEQLLEKGGFYAELYNSQFEEN